jgi:outer membrane protein, multidrug efflux system
MGLADIGWVMSGWNRGIAMDFTGSIGMRRDVVGKPLALAVLVLAIGGCATFAPEERSVDELPVAEAFTLYEEMAAGPDRWWESYGSDELNGLVEQALADNLSLHQIYMRLVQAETVARKAHGARMPQLGYSSDFSSTRRHTDVGSRSTADKLDIVNTRVQQFQQVVTGVGSLSANPLTGLNQAATGVGGLTTDMPGMQWTTRTESYGLGLSGSWEVDLWGRLRAQEESALADLEASRENVYAAMLSLSGAVVHQWLTIVANQQELALSQRQLELNRTTLELMDLRYRKGMATALDVYQQRQIVAQTESLLPGFEMGVRVAQHELAVLLGQEPRDDSGIKVTELPGQGALPETGLPADLLARRPDLRIAGLQLRSADWQIAAARADRLPALRLTGSASYGSEEWDLVFRNWMATLAAGVTGPIFDGGGRKAEVDRTRAVAEERLAAYRESVLIAVKEVENALFQELKQTEYIEALQRRLDATQASYDQALARYRKGLNDYLPVLSSLSELQVLERSLVQARYVQHGDRVALYLALGGSWMVDELAELED